MLPSWIPLYRIQEFPRSPSLAASGIHKTTLTFSHSLEGLRIYCFTHLYDLLQWKESESVSHLVMSDSLQHHGLKFARLLCSWNSPGRSARVAILFSKGSSQPTNWTWISHIAGRFFTIWVARESQYSQRTQVQISLEKRCMVQSPGDSYTRSFQLFSPSKFVTELTSSSSHGGNVHMVYCHQGSTSKPWWPKFNWGLVMWTWLTTCVVDLSHLTLWRLS